MTDQNEVELDAWLDSIEGDPHAKARDASDLRAIGEALIGVERADAELVAAVTAAKAAGRSWTEIAMILGVSRQAARQRFTDSVVSVD